MVLGKLIQDNTEKLSFLTILEEEQLALRKVLKQVPISEASMIETFLYCIRNFNTYLNSFL